MKKRLVILLSIAIIAVAVFAFAGCSFMEDLVYGDSYEVKIYSYDDILWATEKIRCYNQLNYETLPERKGYTFMGFGARAKEHDGYILCIDKDGKGTNITVKEKTLLYGLWDAKSYDVYFHMGNYENSASEKRSIRFDSDLNESAPKNMIVDGHIVAAWSSVPQDTKLKNIVTKMTTDGELHLYPADLKSAIMFDSDGGNEIPMIVGNAGSILNLPVAEKSYANFKGWYKGGNKFESLTMPDGVTTLKAQYTYNVNVYNCDGSVSEHNDLSVGSKVDLGQADSKEGYEFAGWYLNGKKANTVGNSLSVTGGGEVKPMYYKYEKRVFDSENKEYASSIATNYANIEYQLDDDLKASLNSANTVKIKFSAQIRCSGHLESGLANLGVDFYPTGDTRDPKISGKTVQAIDHYLVFKPYSLEVSVNPKVNKFASKFIVRPWQTKNDFNNNQVQSKENVLEFEWLDKFNLHSFS